MHPTPANLAALYGYFRACRPFRLWKLLPLLLLAPTGAVSQEVGTINVICMPEPYFSRIVSGKYGESPLVNGKIRGENVYIEVWTNRVDGTFTLVFYPQDGVACVIAVGDDLRPGPKEPGNPS